MTVDALPRAAPSSARRIAAGSLFVGAIVATAAVAAWPIHRTGWFLLLVGVSASVATGLAVVAHVRRWSGWTTAAALAASFLVFGIPLAVPSRLGGPVDLLRGLAELLTGSVLAWKDLVTVDLPVGTYRNLLVPALVVFLVGTCLTLLLSWRADRLAYAAAPTGLAMVSFGLLFGRSDVSAPLAIGPVTLYAPVETAVGIAALVATLLWLVWRTHEERVQALHRASDPSGVRPSRRPTRADRRRTAVGAGMLVLAVVVAGAVVPFAARGADREVLRSAVGPEVDLAREVSPLAAYRALFAEDRADAVLFRVSGGSESVPSRIRIATLDSYDGEVFRAGGADGQAAFARVPAALDPGPGTPVEATIYIEELEGIWMPTAGRLASAEFAGDRAPALAESFYYSPDAAAGVQTAEGGLAAGDAYTIEGVVPAVPDVAAATAPGGSVAGVAAPESLTAWVERHRTGSDGAALEGLVRLLRERGYLSHGLASGEEPPSWAESLPGYSFQPSASGHSLARIDALFTRLLERETDPRAEASGNFVAAVGDDEQFAVAVALIARELGFPARVVVGARLSTADPGLATCDDGVCRGQDITAWTEVQDASGAWIDVDVTPQYESSPSLEVTEQRDPENVTEVRPDAVEDVVPPDPVQEDSGADDGADAAGGPDLAWLWPWLRGAGVVAAILLLAFGPFLVIMAAKAIRRHGRRTQGAPASRIAGGWDEYVDAAVDAGLTAPRAHTRRELATEWSTPSGGALADRADRAVFSPAAATLHDADEFWRIVDDERRALSSRRGFWRRLAATVSLRSFVRPLAPTTGRRERTAEGGPRRSTGSVRTSP